ncbi:extracellular solute-binding protein [Spirillospora sp. CA-294931]|uniref:extracellular solute-binding protein n=1 Tax=Spirillospora sp. CA-294931 TaxID=3240042 RepID=UPI003D8CE1B8
MSTHEPINRRTLLRLGVGAGLGVAAAPLLSACGGGGAAAGKAERFSAALLPTTTPRDLGLKPDLPGTAAGVPQGFYTYPKNLVRSVPGTPLAGAQTIKASLQTFSPPAPGRSGNAAWKAIEERLGCKVDVTAVPADDWPTKFSTMVASGDIADIFMWPETGGVSNKAAFLDAKCADLTPHLSGDKVKSYPNLAALPRTAWLDCVFGGKLYAVPITRTGSGGAGFYRHDLFAKAGVTRLDQITDVDRFFELCKQLTRPKDGVYAIMASVLQLMAMSHGAPYYWRLDEKAGKFTVDLETPEYRAAVEMARKLHEAGCYYPGSVSMTNAQKAQYTDLFKNGKAAMVYDGLPNYLNPTTGYIDSMAQIDAGFDVRPMVPVGSKAVTWADNTTLRQVHIKKAPDARVKQLLQLANFAAAPFGTEEYTLIQYGVEGVDHRRDGEGNPILTKQGSQDIAVPWKMLASPLPVVYSAGKRDAVRHQHEAQSKMIPMMAPNAIAGLTSPTWDSKGLGSLHTLKADGLKDIISGRKPMSAYDSLVKEYLSKGGEKCRAEFQEALQKG